VVEKKERKVLIMMEAHAVMGRNIG